MALTQRTMEIWQRVEAGKYTDWDKLGGDITHLKALIEKQDSKLALRTVRGLVREAEHLHKTRQHALDGAGVLKGQLAKRLDPILIEEVARLAKLLRELLETAEPVLKVKERRTGDKPPAKK